MYLSNREIRQAILDKSLIVDPPPEFFAGGGYDETSIDLHMDDIDHAKVWDMDKFMSVRAGFGNHLPFLELGAFNWKTCAGDYLMPVPRYDRHMASQPPVYRKDDSIIVQPNGFLLWTTQETVGTPEEEKDGAKYIAFVNAKSTKARTGLMVHFTAPTIHACWNGKITLEIINLGPFHFVIRPGDAVAQLTVATISSTPDKSLAKSKSKTNKQMDPSGAAS